MAKASQTSGAISGKVLSGTAGGMKLGNRVFLNLIVLIWAPALGFLVWLWTSSYSESPYFPPLTKILSIIPNDFIYGDHFVDDVVPSLIVVLVGLLIASLIGIVGGYAIAQSRLAREVTRPFIDSFRAVPAVALVPVAIVILGPGTHSEIFLVAFSSLWPILLNTIAGVSGIEPSYWDVAKFCRLSRLDTFLKVSIPAAAPSIMAGIHTSLALAVIVMVTMEMFASTFGIGRYLIGAQRSFAIPTSFAGAIVVGLMGYGLAMLFTLFEFIVLRWYFQRQGLSTFRATR